MRLWRVLPWDPSARPGHPGHATFVPRQLQGSGRHDAPDHYGCLYVSEEPVPAVAETLAPFRGSGGLTRDLLERSGHQLALAEIELDDRASVIDLDDPAVLSAELLRPSVVATSVRSVTQAYALQEYERHPEAAGLRWWSTLEASWVHLTLFDRALGYVKLIDIRNLTVTDEAVLAASVYLGLD